MNDKATQLAYDRTWLAYERTMQAWIRTAISLITFGFTVYKLADIVEQSAADRTRIAGPHEIGYVLVAIGIIALAFAAAEYRESIRVLREEYGKTPRSKSVLLGALIALVGIFALLSMAFNV